MTTGVQILEKAAINEDATTQNVSPSPTITPEIIERNDYTREGLKRYVGEVFTKYGLESRLPEAYYVIGAESSWIWDNDNGISYGLVAYLPSTWKYECQGNILDPYAQIDCFGAMWSRGEETQWQTWCRKYTIDLEACEWAY